MALISLSVCAGWSEPLLVAHTTLFGISCHGSFVVVVVVYVFAQIDYNEDAPAMPAFDINYYERKRRLSPNFRV